MTTIPVDNIPDKTRQAGQALIDAVPQSVTDSSKKVYDALNSRVQWYLEHWEDVIEEAREMQIGDIEDISLAEFLANLPEAVVVSEIPGRLRVRMKKLKGQSNLAREGLEALAQVDGISEVHVSDLTGSVLLFFDKQQYESGEGLLQSISQKA